MRRTARLTHFGPTHVAQVYSAYRFSPSPAVGFAPLAASVNAAGGLKGITSTSRSSSASRGGWSPLAAAAVGVALAAGLGVSVL